MRIGCVYELIDPRDSTPFWVGQTTLTPRKRRLVFHLSMAKRGLTHGPLDQIRAIVGAQRIPLFVVLEDDVPYHLLAQCEERWIVKRRNQGAPLHNKAIGAGSKGTSWRLTEAHKRSIATSDRSGKWADNISLAKQGRLLTSEQEAEMRVLYRQGMTKAELMRRYQVTFRAVRRTVGV